MKNIVLASQSPARKKILSSLGLPFEVIPSQVNEKQYKDTIKDPYKLCQTIARKKVKAIHKNDCWIIGADQVASLNGRIFNKPKTYSKAAETLKQLQGQTHELLTALCLQRPDGSYYEELVINKMQMRSLTKEEIHHYLSYDQPYECAGSYTIEKRGISLFEKIDSPDFNSILGLPLIILCSQLQLWKENVV